MQREQHRPGLNASAGLAAEAETSPGVTTTELSDSTGPDRINEQTLGGGGGGLLLLWV